MTITGHAGQVRWKVRELLDGHRPAPITRYALQKESGVAMNTVRAMYDNLTSGVDFSTLVKIVTALRRLTGNTALDVGDLLEVTTVPLHGDPDRPAFDAAHLKAFRFQPRKDRPVAQRPSEEIIAEIRDRK